MRIQIPKRAKKIIDTIAAAGFEAYVVGGCVRDSLLGREPEDWDITTSARPEQVKALFGRTIDTGIKHGTVTVMIEQESFEVTTYRIDGTYEDGRHPDSVTFTPSLTEDLKRRDFTINAMAYNEESGLVDIFGGVEDIQNKIIRCVGEARERFTEDALRMMRAVRFSAQLGYTIEEKTRQAIRELAPGLRQVSAERIQAELVKILVSEHPDYLRIAYETGITAVILPEFDIMMNTPQIHLHHQYNVGEHTLHSLLAIRPDKQLRLTMLLHDMGKPATLTYDKKDGSTHFYGHPPVSETMAKQILSRLKFDNDTISRVSRLVRYHDFGNGEKPTEKLVRKALNRIGEDIFQEFLLVKRADVLAQSMYMREEKLECLEEWARLYQQIREKGECVSLKTLAVTGNDLIAAGRRPGKELGVLLKALLELVIEHPEYNTKEKLLEEAAKMP